MLAYACISAIASVHDGTRTPLLQTPSHENKKPRKPKKIFRVGKQSVRNMKISDERKHDALLADARASIAKTYAVETLLVDSVCVRVEPTLSRVGSPVKFGIFARKDIAVKERVLWYGGVIRYKSAIEVGHKSHVRDGKGVYVFDGNAYESRLHRPIPMTEDELTQLCAKEYDDEVLHLAPFGYLCNGSGHGGNDNVRAEYTTVIADKIHRQYNIPYLYATKPIYAGDQLLCHYGNDRFSNAHAEDFVPLDAAATRLPRGKETTKETPITTF